VPDEPFLPQFEREEAAAAAGDIIMNAVRGTHGIRNTGDTDMPLLVFEVDAG
jgi:hypothetical protein